MRKKGFTIIELLITITILGILILIALPRFTSYNERSVNTAIKADLKAVQTSVDVKSTELGKLSLYDLKIGDAIELDLKTLQPKNLSYVEHREGYEFWIDGWNTVYYTGLTPPENIKNKDGKLSWDPVDNATEYNVYKVENDSKVSLLSLLGFKVVSADDEQPSYYSQKILYTTTDKLEIEVPKGFYVVSSKNKKTESAPVGEVYAGKKDENEKVDKDEAKFNIKMSDSINLDEKGGFTLTGDWWYKGTNPKVMTIEQEIKTTGNAYGYYIYNIPTNIKTATFELSIKNLRNDGLMDSSMFIRTIDTGIGFYFYPDRVDIYDLVFESPINSYKLDATQYHDYRIVKEDKKATLYIDRKKINEYNLRNNSGYNQSQFFFGDGTSESSANETYYKNIKVATGQALYIED